MAGLEDLHGAVPDGHEAEGDMEIGDRPRVVHVDRRRRQIIIAVLLDSQLDLLVGLISLVDAVLPALRDLDDLVVQRHGPGRERLRLDCIGRAVEGVVGVQMRVGLDRVDAIDLDDLRLLLIRQVVVSDQAVVQVGHQVVGLLAGPDLELDRIGPSVIQRPGLAQIPGDAVLRTVGGAGRLGPDALAAFALGDVVVERADHAVRVVGGDGGQARHAVVHHDVRGAERLDDLNAPACEQSDKTLLVGRLFDAALLGCRDGTDNRRQVANIRCAFLAGINTVELAVGPLGRDRLSHRLRCVRRVRSIGAAMRRGAHRVGLAVRKEEDIDGIVVRNVDGSPALIQAAFPVRIS